MKTTLTYAFLHEETRCENAVPAAGRRFHRFGGFVLKGFEYVHLVAQRVDFAQARHEALAGPNALVAEKVPRGRRTNSCSLGSESMR